MKKLRNVDLADRVFTIKAATWSGAGAVIGAAGGIKIAWDAGASTGGTILGVVLGAVVGYGLVFFVTLAIMKGGTATFSTIYAPSGNSTPAKREYSRPQALVAHGHYEEAIQAYQVCCADYPKDPEPYLCIARLYRNELQRFDDAVTWFKKARAEAAMTEALELLVTQEIVEVYTHKLSTPRRAMPELARLAERFPGTEAATWAKQRLQELRGAMIESAEHRLDHEP